MATMDPLNELSRMASTSVPGLGGSENIPRNRSFKELQVASESVSGGATYIPSQTANPFLADLPTLRSTSTAPSNQSRTEESQARTPEERIDDHLQRLFSKYMQKEQEESRRIVDGLYEKRVQEAHEARMKRYVAELHGNRTLGGSSNTPLLSSSVMGVTTTDIQDLDPDTVGPYLDVVYRWNRNRQERLEQILQSFQNLAWSPADSCAWRLLGDIIARNDVGALSFYCHQFQQIVKGRVRNASAAGQDISTPYSLSHGMAQVVASYVKLTTNITSSPWPIFYYCLRCGDAAAAMHVLDATNTQVDSALHQIVSSLARTQGSLSCVWDAPLPPVISASVRQEIAALYDRTKHLDSADPYHVASLALLCATDLDAVLASPVVRTTEDYMYGGLWYALNQSFPMAAMKKLANNIKELGPASFPKDTEWGYALPLMAAQQYGEALTHVAKTNILQATHMALMLDAAKVELNEPGSTSAPSLVTTLLLEYAKKLQQKDIFAAAEYLVRIPNESKAQNEVARIVVESQQPDVFAVRLQELFLDKASIVLVEAAEQARTRGYTELAAHLLWCAERFDLLLSLLNNQLALEMANGVDSLEWRNKALAFHHENLANGKDLQIQRVLEESGTQDRLETFRILLDLNQAFLFAKEKDYERAWQSIERLPLLPSSKAQVDSREIQYASLDPAIKKVFPMVLEVSIESLSQMYAHLKSASYGQSTSQQLQALREKAQMLLYSFVGDIKADIPPETYSRMANMEKSMM